jgi:hypothetical protein
MQEFNKILEGISEELGVIQGSPTQDAIYKLKAKVDGVIAGMKEVNESPAKPEVKLPEEPEKPAAPEPEVEVKPEE